MDLYLPDMKGGGGWTWLMLMNKYDAGNSIHKINEYIDGGDIIVQEKYIFPKNTEHLLKQCIHMERLSKINF